MDVPDEILEDLTCSKCETFLARGPVYLQQNEKALCGRCYAPRSGAIRNKYYEATAKLLKFPCKNRDLGCMTTIPYTVGQEDSYHEQVCEYRQYVCPVTESGKCEWLSSKSNMLEHCRVEHPNQVVHNPISLTHDIKKSSSCTYLMVAFNLLFLLFNKICLKTGKIYYCVRYMGAAEEAAEFSYTLEVKRGAFKMTKPGEVASQGCLAIQEHLSLAMNVNSLLDVLGGFDDTMFTILVERSQEAGANDTAACDSHLTLEDHLPAPSGQYNPVRASLWDIPALRTFAGANDTTACESHLTLEDHLPAPSGQSNPGRDSFWDIPSLRTCKHPGCTYKDIDKKCQKHQTFFCRFGNVCRICSKNVQRSLLGHYITNHTDITFPSGSFWTAVKTSWRWFIIDAVAVCRYRLTISRFDLDVWSSADSKKLKLSSDCILRLVDPDTECELIFNMDNRDTLYNDWADWRFKVPTSSFPSWSGTLNVSVDIDI